MESQNVLVGRGCSRLNFIYPGPLGDSSSNSNSLTESICQFQKKRKHKKEERKEYRQIGSKNHYLSITDIIKIIE